MESDSTISWVVLTISALGFSVVSLAVASVLSVRRARVQMLIAREVPGATALDRLYSHPLGPAGVLEPLRLLFLASSVVSGAALLTSLGDVHSLLVYPAALAVLGVLASIHVVARAVAPALGEPISLRIAPAVQRVAGVLRPVLAVESAIARRVAEAKTDEAVATGDLPFGELGASAEADNGPIDEREARMIRGVVGLDQTTAREIMVPRVDVVAGELGAALPDVVELMLESGHSRIPIHTGDLDHIEGIAYSRDILGLLSREENPPRTLTRDVIRPAIFIPESKTLEELLGEFQERQVHLAVVVDEYGGVSGLVTIEDLLEEIVGEIHDEFDVGEPEIEAVSEREFLLDGGVSIDQLDELLHVAVEGDGFDTVGGFVYHRLGRIPSSGDVVEYDGLKIEVVSTAGRRIKRLRVTRTSDS